LLARQTVAGGPSQLLLDASAHLFVTARDANVVREYDILGYALKNRSPSEPGMSRQLLTLRREIPTDVEPVAMALTEDSSSLLVAAGWGHSLTAFSTESGARVFSTDLAREPRSVALFRDRAYVSHAAGAIVSVVDLKGDHAKKTIPLRGEEGFMTGSRNVNESRSRLDLEMGMFGLGSDPLFAGSLDSSPPPPPPQKPPPQRFGVQGFAIVAASIEGRDRLLVPEVLAQPGEMPKIERGEPRPTGYGSFGGGSFSRSFGTETAHVAVIIPTLDHPTTESMKLSIDDRGCLLPRAAVFDDSHGTLFVSCIGTNRVVELDAHMESVGQQERGTWSVPSGPTGLAIDADRLYVWSAFDHVLTIIGRNTTRDFDGAFVFASATKERAPTPFEVGQKIFHATGSVALSKDGRACASCHPDGRDDGLTWASPDGPRQTPMLAGRLRESAPFGWTDGSKTVHDHLQKTIARLEGRGMDDESAYALMTYLERMRVPTRTIAPSRDAQIARGKALFASYDVGCSSCHDSKDHAPTGDGEVHDIGSGAKGDAFLAFATPSLRYVGGTAPYFHDGRYSSVRELLKDTDGRMGDTGQLSEPDLDALVAYVESL
jgi:hypothetical protein